MSESTPAQRCGKCGAALSGYAPDGLCAACLLESAFEDQDLAAGEQSKAAPLLAFNDYELLEEIARGGMGVVYRARQKSLNRPVAIKMILGGHLANAAELKRFRAEAETAAQLQHPNIVAIHEVGEHAGQPFFSMDLVEGRNLAQLVRDEPLPSRKAAAYLKTIAEVVQYAHSRGVLHRDLKPSNILVDEHDQPRITDFGLAKRFGVPPSGGSGDEQTVTAAKSEPAKAETPNDLTITGQVLGSPSFISPEQAAGLKAAIGPASDVYSLGAILYHLLTARPPFVAETLTQTLRMVAEQEPVSPRLLNASVPRDLETICLKCLEKDPRRRYASAQELADELGLLLGSKPIHARPVSMVAKIHRWCLRNKPLAATGTAILALLLVVAIGSPIALIRINRERVRAQAQAAFLASLLEGVGPSVAQGRDTALLKEILTNAEAQVGKDLARYPDAEADMRLVIGKTYIDLGDFTNALAVTQEALRLRKAYFGPRHITVAQALNNLGAIKAEMGDLAAAEGCDRQALEMKTALLGPEDPDVATTMSNLGYRLLSRGDFAGAEPLLREALRIRLKKLDPQSRDVAMSRNNLAMVLWSRGEFDEAESQFREALAIFRKLYPGNHPAVATLLNNVGDVLRQQGRLEDAERMMREALAMRQKVLPPRHPNTAYTLHNLATVLERRGKLDDAESSHKQAVAVLQESLGTNHQYVSEALCTFAILLGRKGDLAGAEAMLRESLATAERALGKDNPGATEPLDRLAILLAAIGDFGTAANLLTNALAILRKSAGAEHPDLIPALRHLAWVRQQQGDPAAAESLYREATAISRKGGNYSLRAFTDSNYDLADLLQAQHRFDEAETLLLGTSAYLSNRPKGARLFQRPLRERLAGFYESWDRAVPNAGKGEEAAGWGKKLEELSNPTP